MVCLGFKPRAAGWKAWTNPLSYGGTPIIYLFVSILFHLNTNPAHIDDVISVRPGSPGLSVSQNNVTEQLNVTVERDIRMSDKMTLVTKVKIFDEKTHEMMVSKNVLVLPSSPRVIKMIKFNMLIGREPWSSGYGRRLMCQRSWVRIPTCAWHYSHLFVVKIVMMCVRKDENEWKRGRGWPI